MDEGGREKFISSTDKEENDLLEEDKCLEKKEEDVEEGGGGEGRKRKEEDLSMKNKIKLKFACLGLRWTGLILLFVLVFLVLAFFIVVIVLGVKLASHENYNILMCRSPLCLRTSSDISASIRTDLDPCSDFYQFACGNWQPSERVDGDILWDSEAGRETNVKRYVKRYRAKIREAVNTWPRSNVESVEWKMKAFYESCMNEDNVEMNGFRPIKFIIDQLHGWSVLGYWVMSLWDTNKIIRRMHGEFGVFPFFKATIQVDDVNIIKIEPAGLGLPLRSYYFLSHEDEIIKAYKRLLHDVAVHLGATGSAAQTFADNTFNFECRLAQIYPSVDYRSQLRYPQDIVTVYDLRGLDTRIEWMEYLNIIFRGYPVTDSTKISANLTYIKGISALWSSTDKEILNNYMMWTLVHHYIPYLSSKFRSTLNAFQFHLTGSYHEMSRWEFCIQETERLFPLGVAKLYLENHIPTTRIERVATFFEEIVRTFLQRIDNLSWMESESKYYTKEKLRSLKLSSISVLQLNGTDMISYYSEFIVLKSDFFQNILKGVEFQNRLSIRLLRNESNPEWHQNFLTKQSSPFVTLSRRRLIIPLFLYDNPALELDSVDALSFGSLGWLISRALIQGFEDVDEYDRYWHVLPLFHPIWWSNQSCILYHNHQRCIAEEYSKYFIDLAEDKDRYYVNGNQTQDENMADIAGLTLAYQAFENWLAKHDNGQYLPALRQFSQNQLFFISFAQGFCSKISRVAMLDDLQRSKTSPNMIRVKGSLSHFPEFSNVFSCSYHSPMNSIEKCNVW